MITIPSLDEINERIRMTEEAKARNITAKDVNDAGKSTLAGLAGAAAVLVAYEVVPSVAAKALVYGAPVAVGVVAARKVWKNR